MITSIVTMIFTLSGTTENLNVFSYVYIQYRSNDDDQNISHKRVVHRDNTKTSHPVVRTRYTTQPHLASVFTSPVKSIFSVILPEAYP
jgi:hypothetical protein